MMVILAGYLGPLARATADALKKEGASVALWDRCEDLDGLSFPTAARLVVFPFNGSIRHADARRWDEDLDYLKRLLDRAARSGITRVVLRSHAIIYGSSTKNAGLMDENRQSLLPRKAMERRWLRAEKMLRSSSLSAAAIRLTNVLDVEEGDFITRMLMGKVAVPLAGYDPRVQVISLRDAAEALTLAALSEVRGAYNVTAEGTVSFRDALKCAAKVRIPVGKNPQGAIRNLMWKLGWAAYPAESLEQIQYNWTVSGERARGELNFHPSKTSLEALREFLLQQGRNTRKLRDSYDDFGLDPDYLATMEPWFHFLRKIYWRVEVEGIENVPCEGAGLLVSNHRGFMPFDGVIHRSLIQHARKRQVRFLVIPSLFKFPFLSDFLIKQGGVVASQENTRRLFQRQELVGFFPEGINGAFRMYKGAYVLGEMGKDAFAKMAIENGVPIAPAATIGHVEIFPILARIRISALTRFTGWPFLPITPTFPLLPLPLPTKWHIRYLEPIPVGNLRPQDAQNAKIVRDFSGHVRDLLQRNVNEMLSRRKHIFFGNIFDRRALLVQQPARKSG